MPKQKKKSPAREKCNRKSSIFHIEAKLFEFMAELKSKGFSYPIKNKIVMHKAEELCPSFSSKGTNAKQLIISRFMKAAKLKMPPPPRKASKNLQSKKLHPCRGIECTSNSTCRRQHNCPIHRIINHSYKTVSKLQSKNKGQSLIIQENCKKNEFVIEYRGKSVSSTDIGEYVMKLGRNQYIDGNIKGNVAKYVNHSCYPNCQLHIVSVNDQLHACLFATKFIRSGTELTFDYQWDKKPNGECTTCYCGNKACRGSIEKI